MLRTIIIDDESMSRKSLKAMLEKYCSGVEVVAVADSVQNGVQCIRRYNPDLVLLDIKMQDGTGFDLLTQIDRHNFQLIFTTAYNEYAIRAFKFSAVDYLLKPIDVGELEAAIERVKEFRRKTGEKSDFGSILENLLTFNDTDPRITISTEQTLEMLSVREIVRLESSGAYTHFVMSDGRELLSSKHLKHYDAMMIDYNFMRIHNSHVINLSFVTRYLKGDNAMVELQNGEMIPVSRRRRDLFMEKYSNR